MRAPKNAFVEVADFVGADPDVVPETVGTKVNVHVMFRSRRGRGWAQQVPERVRDLTLLTVAAVNTREASRPPIPPEVEERLHNHYLDHVAELEELLGRELPWSRSH